MNNTQTVSQKREIIKSIVVLSLICVVVSAALAVVNHFTAPLSAAHAREREETARMQLIPSANGFETVEAELPENVLSAYRAVDADGQPLGYVFTTQGKGFDGMISVMCAIDPTGHILQCRTLDVSSETKTLGGKTADESYTNQYIGKDAALEGVDGISQATITSTAYRGCVQLAFEAYEQISEVGQ